MTAQHDDAYTYNRRLARGLSHNEIVEQGGPKSRKPISITRPDMDGILLAERIILATNLTATWTMGELRRAHSVHGRALIWTEPLAQ